MAARLQIAILYNAPSLAIDDPDYASEAGVLASVEAVSAALLAHGHGVRPFAVGSSVEEFLPRVADLADADVVFNLFEGFGGVGRGEAEVAGLVELLGHSITGSPASCLELVRDKARTKWLLAGGGVPTAPFILIREHEPLDQIWEQIGPEGRDADLLAGEAVFVKPAHEDASLGIGYECIVHDRDALVQQVERVRARYGPVLVERFVVGREFNAAILGTPEPRLLPLAEIEFTGAGPAGWQIVTYDAKWDVGSAADRATAAHCPARVDGATAERIGQVALDAFRLAGCRDYARVDMRMDPSGQIFVLEVNGNPDIDPAAGFARAVRTAGFAYEDFVEQIVCNAAERRQNAQRQNAQR